MTISGRSLCMDCKINNHDIARSGSFLCDDCQKKLSKKIKGNTREVDNVGKTTIELVEELMVRGMKPAEIAKELNIASGSVYTYRSKIRSQKKKEGKGTESLGFKEEAKKKNATERESYEDLTRSYTKLKHEYRALDLLYKKMKSEREVLLSEQPRPSCDCNFDELHAEKERHAALLKYTMLLAE